MSGYSAPRSKHGNKSKSKGKAPAECMVGSRCAACGHVNAYQPLAWHRELAERVVFLKLFKSETEALTYIRKYEDSNFKHNGSKVEKLLTAALMPHFNMAKASDLTGCDFDDSFYNNKRIAFDFIMNDHPFEQVLDLFVYIKTGEFVDGGYGIDDFFDRDVRVAAKGDALYKKWMQASYTADMLQDQLRKHVV